ncbi:MAG: hypothetical protein WD771_09345 [Gemmatimonadaceae bacterium]
MTPSEPHASSPPKVVAVLPTSDAARGWADATPTAGLHVHQVETVHGGLAFVIPLGIPPRRVGASSTAPTALEVALDAVFAIRAVLEPCGTSTEDVTALTLAAGNAQDLAIAVGCLRMSFRAPRPVLQSCVTALPAGCIVAVGAVAVPRRHAAVRPDYSSATLL